MSGRRVHKRIVVWLAIVAAVLPLCLPLLPGAGGSTARAATLSELLAAELCSISHAAQDDGTPASEQQSDQHCPLCRSFQQLGSCVLVEPGPTVAVVWREPTAIPPLPSRFFPSTIPQASQPRGPPVRV